MRYLSIVLMALFAGCGAETATVEEACQQLGHCGRLGSITLEDCAARYEAAGWSGECFGAIAGTACQDMQGNPWVEACADPCYEDGEDRCLPGAWRESCSASGSGLYWMPYPVHCECEAGWVQVCDLLSGGSCRCSPA